MVKLQALQPTKILGRSSFGLLLQTLCLRLVVMADDSQFERIEHRLLVRDDRQVRHRHLITRDGHRHAA
jgi:hypothetical protein